MCVCSTNLGFSGKKICACVRLILVLVGGRQNAIVVARYDSMIPGTYYVPDTYVPGISRQKSIRTYVMFLFLFPLFVSARHPHIFGNKSTWNLCTIVH